MKGGNKIEPKQLNFNLFFTYLIHQSLITDPGIPWVFESGFQQSCLDNIPTLAAPRMDLLVRVGQFVLGVLIFPKKLEVGTTIF